MEIIKGIPANGGIAIGPAFVYEATSFTITRQTVSDIPHELTRFKAAIDGVDDDLMALKTKTARDIGAGEAEIFEVHRMFLADPSFKDAIEAKISKEQLNAEAAVDAISKSLGQQFQALDDDYFRARANDVHDVSRKLLYRLLNISNNGLTGLSQAAIIIANDLTPSDTVTFPRDGLLALCTEIGSATSHTVILARSLNIPAIVGLGAITIKNDDMLIVDGAAGKLIINPDSATIEQYQKEQQRQAVKQQEALSQAAKPATTVDGHQVEVVANIGSLADAQQAIGLGAEGVGLLRTEFLFLEQATLPSEDEQYNLYRAIADVFQQLPLIIRTLDVGGDKALPSIKLAPEQNPFLGQRAIRLCLANPTLFQPQLRAILRASVDRNVKIMLPFISSLKEWQQAKTALEQAQASLTADQLPFNPDIEVGMMIELPSAAVLADLFAPQVDFFSIGSNDLTQYTLAVDRTNERVAHLADPLQPAVIRLIRQVIEAAHQHGKRVGLCGEMAGNPLAIPLLLGLGLDEFSMAAPAIPQAKAQLRKLSRSDSQHLAQHCLTLPTLEAVQGYLKDNL